MKLNIIVATWVETKHQIVRNWPWPFQQSLQLWNFDLCFKAYLGAKAKEEEPLLSWQSSSVGDIFSIFWLTKWFLTRISCKSWIKDCVGFSFYLPSPKKYLATEPFKIWTQVWEFWIHFDRVTIYGRTTVRRKLEISLLQPLVVHHGQSLREMGKTGAMFIQNMGKTTSEYNFNMDHSTDK